MLFNIVHEEVEYTKRGNQKPCIKEGQTTQWPKMKKYKGTNNDLQYTT